MPDQPSTSGNLWSTLRYMSRLTRGEYDEPKASPIQLGISPRVKIDSRIHAQDKFDRAAVIKEIDRLEARRGGKSSVAKEIGADEFGAIVSMKWLANAIAPEALSSYQELAAMKVGGAAYFKNLFLDQKGRLDALGGDSRLESAALQNVLQAVSQRRAGIIPSGDEKRTWKDLSERLSAGLAESVSKPKSCLLVLHGQEGTQVITVANLSGALGIFDPDHGLIMAARYEAPKIIRSLWERHQAVSGKVLPVVAIPIKAEILSQIDLNSYIDAADRFDQKTVAKEIGAENGFDAVVSMQWILNCVAPGAASPDAELRTLKGGGTSSFSELFQKQKEKAGLLIDKPREESRALHALMQTMSKGHTGLILSEGYAQTWGLLHRALVTAMSQTTSKPKSCFMALRNDSSSHIIALTLDEVNHQLRIFDPDHGIITVQQKEAGKMINYLWERREAVGGKVFPVISNAEPEADIGEPDLVSDVEEGNKFKQGDVMDELGAGEAEGFCAAVSTQWVLNCVASNARSPEEELRQMKANGTNYFKQLHQSQQASDEIYIERTRQPKAPNQGPVDPTADRSAERDSDAMQDAVQLMSKNAFDIIPSKNRLLTWDALHQRLMQGLQQSTSSPKSCLIYLRFERGGHIVGATEADGMIQMFDPNFGIIKTEPGNAKRAVQRLWRHYINARGMVLPVIPKTGS
ncbi:MAG: YopT-type cysteine protease domain-containing protein [Dongiaceae bacterium]